jgi:D-cysteine desulfhydrase
MTTTLRGPAGTPLAPPPRTPLAVLPTPLVPAPRLAGALGLGDLFIKRDDLTGFAFAGNKARPLEFLAAGAISEGADTLLTGGAPGSNFCAATAAAAQREGLACHLVLAGDPVPPGPALSLALAWGASVTWTRDADRASVDRVLPRAARELTAAGRRPYLIPRGGATALGAAGYFLAASELAGQLDGLGVRTAGAVVTEADVEVTDMRGPGHGLPSADGAAAAAQAMRMEGLMTDPVYTAKALSLVARQRGAGPVVFWHTGGQLDVVAAAQEAAR